MKTLNEHIKKQLLEDESLKYALATNLAKYGRPQSKKSDKPSKLTKGLEKKREKNVKDLKKAGLEENSKYNSSIKQIENEINKFASDFSVSVSMNDYAGGRPDTDPLKNMGFGEVMFIEKQDIPENIFNQTIQLLKNKGFEIKSSDRFYDYEPGERDFYPKIKFHFKQNSTLGEATKNYGEKISQKLFSKLKGKRVKYYGTVYTVTDSDDYTLTLKDEDGKVIKVNLNQFTQKGMVDEKKKKRDRCLKIADRKFEKPSAYKSGAVVRCRKGDIWKGIKESVNTLDEKKKETLRTWFSRKGAPGKTGGWVDCNSPIRKDGKITGYKPCGRQKGEKRSKYPSCRPTPAGCKDKGKGKTWGKTK